MIDAVGDRVILSKLSEQFPELIDHVMLAGNVIQSRAGATKEILDFRLELLSPEFCVVERRGMNLGFMTEEIIQLLAGGYDQDRLTAQVARSADLITPVTSYGPRIYPQLLAVRDELRKNPESRRAVVYIGREDDLISLNSPIEAAERAGEMPCTCVWQFHLRDNQLHMGVYMRSWDLVWGLSYDIPSFVSIQMALAGDLGVNRGIYVHTAGSAHVYDRHWNLNTWPNDDGALTSNLQIPDPYFLFGDTLEETQANAKFLMTIDLEESA
jgi:thymidylate synthase